jgi:hypothetical protein
MLVRAVPEAGREGRPTWAPIFQGPHPAALTDFEINYFLVMLIWQAVH